jgi:hypothetical protein
MTNLVRTREGHLLIWERGTTRYTLGYRITRTIKRFYARRWVFAIRPFAVHFIRWPMTEVEKRNRGLPSIFNPVPPESEES